MKIVKKIFDNGYWWGLLLMIPGFLLEAYHHQNVVTPYWVGICIGLTFLLLPWFAGYSCWRWVLKLDDDYDSENKYTKRNY